MRITNFVVGWSLLAVAAMLVPSCGRSESQRQYAELLAVDPFSSQQWAGDAINIYGIHIGQIRTEAIAAASTYDVQLVNYDNFEVSTKTCSSQLCVLDIKRLESFSGVEVRFTPNGSVYQISLSTIPFEMEDAIKAKFSERFHGSLLNLMTDYTLDLQQRILGDPSATESPPPDVKGRSDRTYHYAARGLALVVDLPVGKSERSADLEFKFCKPTATSTIACESK